MAKVVIAGRADCPYFARIELLADRLARNLPDFKLHKIVKQPDDWSDWLKKLCEEKGWPHTRSPIAWRELVDRGGKGILIGGANEFQEYVAGYYGMTSEFTTSDMNKIAGENHVLQNDLDAEEAYYNGLCDPIKICITNASNSACYGIIEAIARGEVFGSNVEISLNLLDSDKNHEYLSGIEMEATDLAYPLLRYVQVTSNPIEAFTNCTVVIMLDELERDTDSDEAWLKRIADHFTDMIKVIDRVSLKNVKVLVAGEGPTNFMTYMMSLSLKNISHRNVVAMPRVIENQAKAIISRKLKVNSADVVDVIIWGSTSGRHFCDLTHTRIHNHDGPIWGPPFYSRLASLLIHEDKWLQQQFHESLQNRQSEELTKLGRGPTLARSSAIVSLLTQWYNSGPASQMFTLGVVSEGWYGVPEGLVFNFPVSLANGDWTIVPDLILSDTCTTELHECITEAIELKYIMFPELRPIAPSPPPAAFAVSSSDTLAGSLLPAIREEMDAEVISQLPLAETEAGVGDISELSPPLDNIADEGTSNAGINIATDDAPLANPTEDETDP